MLPIWKIMSHTFVLKFLALFYILQCFVMETVRGLVNLQFWAEKLSKAACYLLPEISFHCLSVLLSLVEPVHL